MQYAAPVPAAAVIVLRPPTEEAPAAGPSAAPEGPEVYLVRRGAAQRFLGDFSGFPGGCEDATDGAVPVVGAAPAAAAACACAARELFEETGILLGTGAALPPAPQLAAARRALLAGELEFAALLRDLGLAVDGAALLPAGRWITPEYLPLRYDTHYFVARLPAGATATVIPGELTSGEWVRPAAALAQWRRAEVLLPAPVLAALRVLAADGADLARLAAAPAATAADEAVRRNELAPGLLLVPLTTPTLPPATQTNCYVVGARELVIVDPGAPDPAEQAVLDGLLARLVGEGARPCAVLLTHDHPDHVGGAAALAARHRLPILAHAATAARLAGRVPVSRALADGEVLTLGGDPPRRLRAVLTAGHCPGHLAFFEEETRALLAGDLVATLGFIIVDPEDGGDMAAYLESLRRARDLDARLLLPAHGLPTRSVRARLEATLAHRLEREARLLGALRPVARAEEELLPEVYADTPPPMWPFAARSLRAHLLKLEREGRVVRGGAGWRTAS
ncbi:MAG TPA: MBL fold metallo-hydrolase [Polyangia bacterium]|jgi:glyoxylase-like metal-dependent hydrolase (beta-lactamase superfamily II)/8-oxo-dGTP pyrophosphatase MutT (NUDIX family)